MAPAIVAIVLGVLVVMAIVFFVPPLRDRVKGIKVSATGISIQFFEKAIEKKENRTPDKAQLDRTVKRLRRSGSILWVDDDPEYNSNEIEALRALGLTITIARSNAEAKEKWASGTYDLVISDIGRSAPEDVQAGLQLPDVLGTRKRQLPVIFYVGHATAPMTSDGYPVVDRPTALIEQLANALQRAPRPEARKKGKD